MYKLIHFRIAEEEMPARLAASRPRIRPARHSSRSQTLNSGSISFRLLILILSLFQCLCYREHIKNDHLILPVTLQCRCKSGCQDDNLIPPVTLQGWLKIRCRHPALDFTRNKISGSKWPTEKIGRADGHGFANLCLSACPVQECRPLRHFLM